MVSDWAKRNGARTWPFELARVVDDHLPCGLVAALAKDLFGTRPSLRPPGFQVAKVAQGPLSLENFHGPTSRIGRRALRHIAATLLEKRREPRRLLADMNALLHGHRSRRRGEQTRADNCGERKQTAHVLKPRGFSGQ